MTRNIDDNDKTPWFDGHVKPVREGWYEVWLGFKYFRPAMCGMMYWNGWAWSPSGPKGSWWELDSHDQWRGLKAPHHAEAP